MEQPYRRNYSNVENNREEERDERSSMDHEIETRVMATPPPSPSSTGSFDDMTHDGTNNHQNQRQIQGEDHFYQRIPIIGFEREDLYQHHFRGGYGSEERRDDIESDSIWSGENGDFDGVDGSDFDHRTSFQGLSPNAQVALQDFSDLLKDLGVEALDEDAFHTLLGKMGYERDRTGLFDELLDEIRMLKPGHPEKNDISVDDMRVLYSSEPYHLLDNAGKDTGSALMEYIDELFDEVDVDRNGCIDMNEVGDLIKKVVARDPSNEEIEELFDVLDADKSGIIDRAELKQYLLKLNANHESRIPSNFNYSLLEPTLATSAQFVSSLESHTLNHSAIKHHFLQNLASAAFDKGETADLLLRFFTVCSHFNERFECYVQRLDNILPDRKHMEILQAAFALENHMYQNMVETLEIMHRLSYKEVVPEDIVAIKSNAVDELIADGKAGLLAAVYFGSELLVPELCKQLQLLGLKHSCGISIDDMMDEDKAKQLREILIENCATKEDRIKFVKNTEKILNARVEFYDALLAQSDFQEVLSSSTRVLCNDDQVGQSIQSHPEDLGDFTSRAAVFEMCKDLSAGATVLNVGCGDGYISRSLKAMGAQKIIGVDMNEGRIEAAKCHCDKSPDEYYIVGDATTLKENLVDQSAATNMMLGAQFDTGLFELAVANCAFDYMTVSEMDKSFEQVYSVLKPCGHFVFSIVLHPSLPSYHEKTDIVSHENKEIKRGGNFTLRGKRFHSRKKIIDGNEEFTFRVHYKTVEDCIHALKLHGFGLITTMEVSRDGEDSAFFNAAVNDQTINMVFKVRKPAKISTSVAVGNATTLDLLPKKLRWNKSMIDNFDNEAVVMLSEAANCELCNAALECYERGLSVDDIVIGQHVDAAVFKTIKPLCISIRSKLLHQTGAVIIQGLDMDALGGEENMEKMEACSKIAYFLLCQHIGTVDGGARGTLFDVKDEKINANDVTVDNVLFSVSSAEADWHTDGASKDRVYDVVGLLCISPAAHGGKFRISNACNAHDDMMEAFPKFMMHEMTRPLPRDVLENGRGLGSGEDIGATLSRSDNILARRIRYNSYPIYVTEGEDRMRFRYMRHWINTGHSKTGWKVPTLLRIAMDILDDRLDDGCVFHKALERGDMIFCNNAMVAHARDTFQNAPGYPPRHKVRAWLQIQKQDLLINSDDDDEEEIDEVQEALTNNLLDDGCS